MPGREAMSKVTYWGRWGKDDQKGTANFITPEVIVAAAKLVQDLRSAWLTGHNVGVLQLRAQVVTKQTLP